MGKVIPTRGYYENISFLPLSPTLDSVAPPFLYTETEVQLAKGDDEQEEWSLLPYPPLDTPAQPVLCSSHWEAPRYGESLGLPAAEKCCIVPACKPSPWSALPPRCTELRLTPRLTSVFLNPGQGDVKKPEGHTASAQWVTLTELPVLAPA